MFYFKTRSLEERAKLIKYLKDNGVQAVFHYIPLHNSPAGKSLENLMEKINIQH